MFQILQDSAQKIYSQDCSLNTQDTEVNEVTNTSEQTPPQKNVSKPTLSPPCIYLLYFILDRLAVYSEAQSYTAIKEDLSATQKELEDTNKKRLAELKEAIDKERSSHKWEIAVKMFTWIASFLGIIAGAALVATGNVAGWLLVVGGVIALTNEILDATGGWDKIAQLLPGDDPDKKRAIVAWIQIGIAVLCLVLSAAGMIFGGMSAMGNTMKIFLSAFGGITQCALGVSTIGKGITDYQLRNRYAKSKTYEMLLEDLKLSQDEQTKKMEEMIHLLGKVFESMHRNLGLQNETFQASQNY